VTKPKPDGAGTPPEPAPERASGSVPDATPEPSPQDDPAGREESEAEAALDADSAEAGDALTEAEAKAAEHLNDLQRLQAEYVNYRKRVERDRSAVLDLAVSRVLEALIPVLDDIAAARGHGELDGPFAAIADKLEGTLGRFGWVAYGESGEPFDPAIHEALTSTTEPGLSGPVVREVAQVGYRLGERVVRPARVVVAQPE
jgi:molecular chaperone GrpE